MSDLISREALLDYIDSTNEIKDWCLNRYSADWIYSFVKSAPAVDAAPRIPYAYVTPEHFLLDLVYNPPLTGFLDFGRQRGARILNGETMFRTQAEASWRIWNE